MKRLVTRDGCPATSLLTAVYAGYTTKEIFELYCHSDFLNSLPDNIVSLIPKQGDPNHRNLIGDLRRNLVAISSKTGKKYPVRDSQPYFEAVNSLVEAGLLLPDSEDHKRALQFHGQTEPAFALAVLGSEQEFAHRYAPEEYPSEPRSRYINGTFTGVTTKVIGAYMVFPEDEDSDLSQE